MLGGPRLRALGRSPPVAQQELAQPVASPQLIALGRQASAHQIAQRLMRRIRHPHRRQIPAPIAARQLLGIAPVGLDPIPGLHRYQRRGDHLALHPQLAQLPVQHVPGRARLVAHPQLLRLAELLDQASDRLRPVRDRPRLRTSPPVSATATAIVSAWTSKPINRTFLIAGSHLYAALRRDSSRFTA